MPRSGGPQYDLRPGSGGELGGVPPRVGSQGPAPRAIAYSFRGSRSPRPAAARMLDASLALHSSVRCGCGSAATARSSTLLSIEMVSGSKAASRTADAQSISRTSPIPQAPCPSEASPVHSLPDVLLVAAGLLLLLWGAYPIKLKPRASATNEAVILVLFSGGSPPPVLRSFSASVYRRRIGPPRLKAARILTTSEGQQNDGENHQTHSHRPQSSSASRFTAGASGFLNFSQSAERLDR